MAGETLSHPFVILTLVMNNPTTPAAAQRAATHKELPANTFPASQIAQPSRQPGACR